MTSRISQFDDPHFDLAYRPESYWDTPDPLSAIRGNIKGQLRREMVTDFVTGQAPEALGEIESDLLRDTLDEDTRRSLGGIHPQWMGGEYLPDYQDGEAEIARIVLDSSTMDVYCFRARRIGKQRPRIHYRAFDEYDGEWELIQATSTRPLTMGAMIRLIDTATCSGADYDGSDLVASIWQYTDPISSPGFVTVQSEYYPQLAEWYRQKEARWIEGHSRDDASGNGGTER